MMKTKPLSKSQKLRVILNGVCFYTTVGKVRDREVSDFSTQNNVLWQVLEDMEYHRNTAGGCRGLSTTHQVANTRYEVQLDLV